jgi:hypothetical protein
MDGDEWHWHVWLPWEKAVWALTLVVSVSMLFFIAAHAGSPAHSHCFVTSTRSVSCTAKATSP